MTAPTVPTAPLPSELQAAIDIAEGRRQQIVNSTQVLSYLQVESCVWRTIKNEVAKLTEQLAASERTCAELRAQVDAMEVAGQAYMKACDNLQARAEAAERTVEGLRAELEESK